MAARTRPEKWSALDMTSRLSGCGWAGVRIYGYINRSIRTISFRTRLEMRAWGAGTISWSV